MTTLELRSLSHIGIRVRDRARSLAFYRVLGFEEAHWFEGPKVAILTHATGLEINLIVNADAAPGAPNQLMDVPEKHPGITHVAFRIASIDAAITALAEASIAISEGPVDLGGIALALFVRDPDGNVIELNQPR